MSTTDLYALTVWFAKRHAYVVHATTEWLTDAEQGDYIQVVNQARDDFICNRLHLAGYLGALTPHPPPPNILRRYARLATLLHTVPRTD